MIDLAEAVLLAGREGEVFDAVVVDEDPRGLVVQLADPAVMVRLAAHRVDPGDAVRVRLGARRPGEPQHRARPRRLAATGGHQPVRTVQLVPSGCRRAVVSVFTPLPART